MHVYGRLQILIGQADDPGIEPAGFPDASYDRYAGPRVIRVIEPRQSHRYPPPSHLPLLTGTA